MESVGDGREGPFRALAARGQRAAHMGEPEAEGQCRVTPRHPAAHLLHPGLPAAAGKRLHPAPAHPVRGRRREARYGGYVALRRGILRAFCDVQSGRGDVVPTCWGGGGVPCRHVRVHDCGRALPEHPSGVAVPVGPTSGRAGPGPPSWGGGG